MAVIVARRSEGPVLIAPPPVAATAPLRILHVFSTFAVGGPQRRFAQIANHFGPSVHHTVRAMDGRTDAGYLIAPDVPCNIVPDRFPRISLLATRRIARMMLEDAKPDLLVTYNWGAIEWALANWPTVTRHVHVEDGFGPEEATRQLKRRVWFRRLVLGGSTVILPSRMLHRIATEIWRLDPARIRLVPNGIACARFAGPADPGFVQRLAGKGPIIGTVATLRREKALDRLIAAFAEVRARRPAHLVIAGDGAERANLEHMVAERGLHAQVTFTGAIDRPERLLGAFDVFAISSDTEQMPLSVLEAMAAALPIASTDAGDILDMVAAENRPFVVPKTVPALADALHRLLDDAGLRARLGDANRTRAITHYDEAQMFAAWDEVLRGNQ